MIPEIGHFALILALIIALVQGVLPIAGGALSAGFCSVRSRAIAAARRALAAGDIAERSKQILKAWEIVQELGRSLNHEQGGEISRQLAELYAFAGQRLLDGNAEQADGPLAEAAAVLATLGEAWQTVLKQQNSAAA